MRHLQIICYTNLKLLDRKSLDLLLDVITKYIQKLIYYKMQTIPLQSETVSFQNVIVMKKHDKVIITWKEEYYYLLEKPWS